MFFANDKNGNRVYAEEAIVGGKYFCPTCNTELILKPGIERQAHFSHKVSCSDKWHYEMSEWHQRMQGYFLPKYREVVVEHNGEKHRADVLIPDLHGGKSLVIEFQHSNMSREEFCERNVFYKNAGYDIVWVFDINNASTANALSSSRSCENLFSWHCPFACLKDYNTIAKPMLPNNIFLTYVKAKRKFNYDILIQFLSYDTIKHIVDVDFDWRGPVEISMNNMAQNFYHFKNGEPTDDWTDASYFFDW